MNKQKPAVELCLRGVRPETVRMVERSESVGAAPTSGPESINRRRYINLNLALTLLTLAVLTPAAKADIFFSQPPSVSGNSLDITDFRLADDFTLSGYAVIKDIGFWYQAQYQTDLSELTYAIYTGQSGVPGIALQSESVTPSLSLDPAGLFFADANITPISLRSGTQYWLELHAGASLTDTSGFTVSWSAADDNGTALAQLSTALDVPDSPVAIPGFDQYAFQLSGVPAAAPTPEPSYLLVLAGGLLALALVASRRRMRPAAAIPVAFILGGLLASAQTVLYVGPSGSPLSFSAGCPQVNPCLTFREAFTAFHVGQGGDVIQASALGGFGPIVDGITGHTPNGVVIDGGGLGYATIGGTFQGDPNQPPIGDLAAGVLDHDATLRNLTITLPGDANAQHVGLWVHGGHVRLENVTITGPGMLVGILVTDGAAVSLDHVRVQGTNGTAVYVRGGTVDVLDSVLEGQGPGSTGLFVAAAPGPPVMPGIANVERTQLTLFGNGIGVDGTQGAASVRLSNSVITGNILSMATGGGGTVTSLRNNMIEGNLTNTLPALSTSLK